MTPNTDHPIPETKLFPLADELKCLRDVKDELETSLKGTNAQIDQIEKKLSDIMAEAEIPNFTRAGTTFCLLTKIRASTAAEDKS